MAEADIFDSLNLERNKVNLNDALGSSNEQSIQQSNPDTNLPVTDQAVPAEAPEVEPYSIGEGFGYAFENETLTGFAGRLLNEPEFEPDPDLNLTVGWFEEQFPDIPRQFRDYLYEGESIPEINFRAEKLRQRISEQERFDAMDPASQIGTLLAATMVDAPALAVSFAAGAVTGGASSAVTAGRLGITGARIARVLGAGTGVAAEAAIQESILATNDPLKNEQTVMLAGLMGFGMGAVGGEIGARMANSQIRKAAQRDQENLTNAMIRQAAEEVTGSKQPFAEALSGSSLSTTVKSTEVKPPLETLYGEVLDPLPSTHVKSVEPVNPLDKLYDGEAIGGSTKLRGAAFDQTSRLKRSKDEGFQKLGNILGEDGIFGGKATMALEFDVRSRPVLADGLKGVNEAYNNWAKLNGIGVTGRIGHSQRLEFNQRMAKVVRGVTKPSTAAEAEGAANAMKFFKDMLEVAKSSGVKGFDDVETNLNYLTRSYDSNSFRRIAAQYGPNGAKIIQRTIKGAILAGENDFDDAIASKIAEGIYNRSMSTKLPRDDHFTTVITNDFEQELRNILDDAGLKTDEIDAAIANMKAKEESGVSQGKRRINLNEGFVDPETNLKFVDLLDNNLEQIMVRYNRQVGGAAAAAKFGFETPQALINHINKVGDDAVARGTLTQGQALRERQNALNLANQVLGRPNEDTDVFKQIAQTLMDYEYIRSSGGFALASVPEMLITTAENGFKSVLSHSPIARNFINDIRKGQKPDDELLKLIESWGIGRDHDLMNAFVRVAEDDALEGKLNSGIQMLNTGKRVASQLSGLPQLTRFSQIIAGKSTIQKFTDMAISGKPVKMRQWLTQLGFADQSDLEGVFNGLRKHSSLANGKSGRVTSLDFDAWVKEDPASANRFMYAVARKVNHQIQRNLPGELPEFMSKTWGKLVMQFRTFGVAAWGKKTLNGLARHDAETAMAIGLSTTLATMIYAGRMWVVAQTRDDPERFLEERLAPNVLVKAAIQRSGYASMLPDMLDTGLSFFQQDKVFDRFTRTSGLDVGGVESIPAAQTAINFGKTIGNTGEALLANKEWQEKDARAATDMLPLRRLPGVNFVFESLINSFPERDEQ